MFSVKEAPGVFSGYDNFIQSLIETKELDAEAKQILYIGMKIVTGDWTGVMYHIPMAKKGRRNRALNICLPC